MDILKNMVVGGIITIWIIVAGLAIWAAPYIDEYFGIDKD